MTTMSQSATRAPVAASRSQSREGPAWAALIRTDVSARCIQAPRRPPPARCSTKRPCRETARSESESYRAGSRGGGDAGGPPRPPPRPREPSQWSVAFPGHPRRRRRGPCPGRSSCASAWQEYTHEIIVWYASRTTRLAHGRRRSVRLDADRGEGEVPDVPRQDGSVDVLQPQQQPGIREAKVVAPRARERRAMPRRAWPRPGPAAMNSTGSRKASQPGQVSRRVPARTSQTTISLMNGSSPTSNSMPDAGPPLRAARCRMVDDEGRVEQQPHSAVARARSPRRASSATHATTSSEVRQCG